MTYVIADVGKGLSWRDSGDCYSFWKSQAKGHVVDDLKRINLERFPDQYTFIASKWITKTQIIIILEKFH